MSEILSGYRKAHRQADLPKRATLIRCGRDHCQLSRVFKSCTLSIPPQGSFNKALCRTIHVSYCSQCWTAAGLHWVYVSLIPHSDSSVSLKGHWNIQTSRRHSRSNLARLRGVASMDHNHTLMHVLIVPKIPPDWLFSRVSAVCHQGEVGMTAIEPP
jgi:hypothetical protein